MTQYLGVIGYPLKHSLSPDFQQAALDYCRLDIRYERWETKVEDLPFVIDQLRHRANLGANVTVPFKETVLHSMDEVDNPANILGAANTIVNRGGKLVAFNTDAHGFVRALREDARFDSVNKRAVIIGAGGAARAVGFALLQQGVNWLAIVNRTLERAEALVGALAEYAKGKGARTEVVALPFQEIELLETVRHCQLVVNCTTLGMKHSCQEGQSPLASDSIPAGALVCDLVYNPAETPLLRMAREVGANVLGGLPMLVYQGAASFALWTGREAPLDIMYRAAKQAL